MSLIEIKHQIGILQRNEQEHSQISRNSIAIEHPGVELVSPAENTCIDFELEEGEINKGLKSLLLDFCFPFLVYLHNQQG